MYIFYLLYISAPFFLFLLCLPPSILPLLSHCLFLPSFFPFSPSLSSPSSPFLILPPSPPNLQGCSAPLVVKIADTEKDKNVKRLQSTLASIGGVNGLGGVMQAAAYYQVISAIPTVKGFCLISSMLIDRERERSVGGVCGNNCTSKVAVKQLQ